MTDGSKSIDDTAIKTEFVKLEGFAPFTTLEGVRETLRSLSRATVTNQFDEQHFDFSGETPEMKLKSPDGVTTYSDKSNSVLFRAGTPSIGLVVKTQFSSPGQSLHEQVIGTTIKHAGSIGVRRIQVEYTIDCEFSTLLHPQFDNTSITGLKAGRNGKNWVMEELDPNATRVKMVAVDVGDVLTNPNSVNLNEFTTLNFEVLDEIFELDQFTV